MREAVEGVPPLLAVLALMAAGMVAAHQASDHQERPTLAAAVAVADLMQTAAQAAPASSS